MRLKSRPTERSRASWARGVCVCATLIVAWAGIAIGVSIEGVSQVEILPDGVRFLLSAPDGDPRIVEREGEPPAIELDRVP